MNKIAKKILGLTGHKDGTVSISMFGKQVIRDKPQTVKEEIILTCTGLSNGAGLAWLYLINPLFLLLIPLEIIVFAALLMKTGENKHDN